MPIHDCMPGGPGSSSGHAEATAVLTEEELTTQHALAEIGLERRRGEVGLSLIHVWSQGNSHHVVTRI